MRHLIGHNHQKLDPNDPDDMLKHSCTNTGCLLTIHTAIPISSLPEELCGDVTHPSAIAEHGYCPVCQH